MKFLRVFVLFGFSIGFSQNTYYISQQNGSDSNDGFTVGTAFQTVDEAKTHLNPGDTLLFVGEFTNSSYNPSYSYSGNINDPYIWTQENTIRINGLNGSPDNYITLKAYDGNTILKGDGANIFRMLNCSYISIEDFNIYGEVENIPLSTALALQFLYREDGSTNTLYRVPEGSTAQDVEDNYSQAGSLPILNNISRPSYTDTRGFYLSNVHHIDLLNNHVQFTPGNGFRVASGDYINIIGNEVDNCSRKSYSGTHGLVVTNANSYDSYDGYKIFILKNKVHHNYNEIFSWAPSKTFITPKIDEGKGISLQRNDLLNGWSHGRFLVANNITYWNGYSGLHSNTGLRIDFVNNTAYMNSYTNTITYANGVQTGKNIGISAQGGEDNKFINNIIFIDNAWGGFPISIANEANDEVINNLVFGINGSINQDGDVSSIEVGTIIGNPMFLNAANDDFSLSGNSPAIDEADVNYAPSDDYFGTTRDSNPDLGAIEYNSTLTTEELYSKNEIKVYPNPFHSKLKVYQSEIQFLKIEVIDLMGKKVFETSLKSISKTTIIDLDHLSQGLYYLKIGNVVKRIVKFH